LAARSSAAGSLGAAPSPRRQPTTATSPPRGESLTRIGAGGWAEAALPLQRLLRRPQCGLDVVQAEPRQCPRRLRGRGVKYGMPTGHAKALDWPKKCGALPRFKKTSWGKTRNTGATTSTKGKQWSRSWLWTEKGGPCGQADPRRSPAGSCPAPGWREGVRSGHHRGGTTRNGVAVHARLKIPEL